MLSPALLSTIAALARLLQSARSALLATVCGLAVLLLSGESLGAEHGTRVIQASVDAAETAMPASNDGTPRSRGAGGRSAVGMCGVLGQSIAAPPPIYPAVETFAFGCVASSTQVTLSNRGLPTQEIGSPALDVDRAAILTDPALFHPRRSSPQVHFPAARICTDEHRAKQERPPRT